jgi:site-specific recombinase XerD
LHLIIVSYSNEFQIINAPQLNVGTTSKVARSKKQCPVPKCNAVVTHLPRHLKNVHHWKQERARNALQVFNLRKQYEFVHERSMPKEKKPDYHHPRLCPVDNCHAVVKRISTHLCKYHHIDKKSGLFKTLVVVARKRNRKHLGNTAEMDQSDDSSFEEDETAEPVEPTNMIQLVQSNEADEQSVDMVPADMDETENDVVPSETPDDDHRAALPTDFLQFQVWLQSADGGRKCEKSAKQHAFQVGVIFEAVAESRHVSALWNHKLLSQFLNVHAVQKQFLPATVKSYLSSLRHWFSYIVAEESDRLTVEEKQQIQQVSDRVSRWIGSYRKEGALKHLEKMDADLGKLITPEKVAMFDRSEPALLAIKILGGMNDGASKIVTQSDYTTTRDFLLTQIIIANANRSGVLANMTVNDFFAARVVDDNHVVSVANHKTAFAYGPAKIVLNPSLFSWMTIFVKYVRCQVRGKTSFLFLSWNGENMESGQITRSVQSVWKKAGLGSDITCTLMRKSAVSSVHQSCPAEKDRLADLMCHTTQTASKCYRLVQRQQTSVAASKVLTQLMKATEAPEIIPAATASVPVKTKFIWTDSLVGALRDTFAREIETNSISLQEVKNKHQSNDLLASVDPRKIYDKIRQECQRVAKADDVQLDKWEPPGSTLSAAGDKSSIQLRDLLGEIITGAADGSVEQNSSAANATDLNQQTVSRKRAADEDSDESEEVCPSTRSSKMLFSEVDKNTIKQHCHEIIASGPISQRRIAQALAEQPSLLQRFTVAQLISRIKYERRMLRMAVPKYFV